jgi:hypothetical protein
MLVLISEKSIMQQSFIIRSGVEINHDIQYRKNSKLFKL